MTDRIRFFTVSTDEPLSQEIIDNQFRMVCFVRTVSLIHNTAALVVLETPMRTDDFEYVKKAFLAFRNVIAVESIVFDGNMNMDYGVGRMRLNQKMDEWVKSIRPVFHGDIDAFGIKLAIWADMVCDLEKARNVNT